MEIRKRKYIGRIIVLLLAMPLVIFVALLTLLYLPPVQRWAVEKAARVASHATGFDIRVGSLRLAFPLDLALTDVVVCDTLSANTLASLGELRTGVALRPLLHGKVQVSRIDLRNIEALTGTLIPSVGIDGRIGQLRLEGGDMDLASKVVELEDLLLHDVDVAISVLPDNAPKDSVSSPVGWKFFLGRAEISQVQFHLTMPADTMGLSVGWEETEVEKLTVNLEEASYEALRLVMADGRFRSESPQIEVEEADIQLDSLFYKGMEAKAIIQQIALSERSGLHLTNTSGSLSMDTSGISIPYLRLESTSSTAQASLMLPWGALKENGKEKLYAHLRGHIGKADMLSFLGERLPKELTVPLNLYAEAYGNMEHMQLDTLHVQMDSVATIIAHGDIRHLTDEEKRIGNVNVCLEELFKEYQSANHSLIIPAGIHLDASLNINKNRFDALLVLHEGEGQLSAKGHYDTRTEKYTLDARIDSLALHHFLPTYPLEELSAQAYLSGRENDTLFAQLRAGDLDLDLCGASGIEPLVRHANLLVSEIQKQIEARSVRINQVKHLLPDVALMLNAGENNPVATYLQRKNGISMESVDVMLNTSPLLGINGYAAIHGLHTDSLALDTVQLTLHQDTAAIHYHALVINTSDKQKPAFTVSMEGAVCDTTGSARMNFLDGQGETGLDLGIMAAPEKEGWRFSLFPEHPVIGFRSFTLNPDNHIYLSDSGRVEGNIALLDHAGMGLRLFSTPNEEALQDLTVHVKQLNLNEILKLMPYAPDMTGMLDAELHYIGGKGTHTFSGTLQANQLTYEDYPLGTIGAEAVYLPMRKNEHIVNLQLMQNGEMIGTADGKYYSVDKGEVDKMTREEEIADSLVLPSSTRQLLNSSTKSISLDINLESLPMEIANAFVPRDIIKLAGKLNGELSVEGSPQSPHIDGSVRFDSVQVHSPLYAMDFRFDKTPIYITKNLLRFENFNIYTKGKNPLTLTGQVNMNNLSNIQTDLQMRATEYELLNAKKNRNSVLHGKVFINLYSTIKGELSSPTVRGTMNVLGNTDVTYILKDSPLAVEDRLGNMVTFVNFNDTTATSDVQKEVSLGGIDMLMNVQIDQGAEMQVDMGNDNYVEVRGGGNLALQYTPQGDLLLTGRYTLDGGEMKYSLPVIPLKTFRITGGSYAEFTGNPSNPYLNITATERVRTSVTEEKNSRYVNFDVGISLTGTLADMGLNFTLDTPEDVTLQNQLAAMSTEERGKLAVTMLVTGMYMGGQGGSGNGFSTSNALNSFLQSEISNIAGSALKTVDVSIGVEDNYAADGTTQGGTDYSFRFAKRFWNNRLSVIIGGRISTGNEAVAEENNSFIDDISLEYRLDDSGTRYVKLFHTKNYESILEGEIIETGAGIVLRRKVNKLGELFIFKRKEKAPSNSPQRGENHHRENDN